MLTAKWFCQALDALDVSFYTGIPDTALRGFCDYLADAMTPSQHVVASNEGGAIGLATGHHLATGKIPVVYMQNSGLGNVINPLLSLVDRELYAIPMVLIIGWRGQPGRKDEPQHVKQGRVTPALLNCLEVPYALLPSNVEDAKKIITQAFASLSNSPGPYSFLVEPGTFAPYGARSEGEACFPNGMLREDAIAEIRRANAAAVFIGTTGMVSRELFELCVDGKEEMSRIFLSPGAMGHCSQIAAMLAAAGSCRSVVCLDGDGAMFMHLGALGVISRLRPVNFLHVVFNNGMHESVGGQPTANPDICLANLAKAAGYPVVRRVESIGELQTTLADWTENNGPFFLEVCVRPGHRKNLGRPTTALADMKNAFIKCLREDE